VYQIEKRQPWSFVFDVFGKTILNDGTEVNNAFIYKNREGKDFVMVNPDVIELRPEHKRFYFENGRGYTRPSVVKTVKGGMSFGAYKCAEEIDGELWMQNVVQADASGGNDNNEDDVAMKNALCYSGLLFPVAAFEEIGVMPQGTFVKCKVEGREKLEKFAIYRVSDQTSSKNRLCKVDMSTLDFDDTAVTLTCNAKYLREEFQPVHKSISRKGLSGTNGTIIKGFDFTFARADDLEIEKEFTALTYYDSKDNEKFEGLYKGVMDTGTDEEKAMAKLQVFKQQMRKTVSANDGMGFMLPCTAKRLAKAMGLKRLPSMFQIRYGQVKGILVVFDFRSYTKNAVCEDVIFTGGMWKSDFDPTMAEFLVANISKQPTEFVSWNYQMITTLNNQLGPDHFTPYLERIKDLILNCTSSIENALAFLQIVPYVYTDENSIEIVEDEEENITTDKLREFILANPATALTVSWVVRSIMRRKETIEKNMLNGHVPMPGSIHIMACDPVEYFNNLRVKKYIDGDGKVTRKYTFNESDTPVMKEPDKEQGLKSGEFYLGGYAGHALAMRTPLTNWRQIRKLNCIQPAFTRKGKDGVVIDWYRFMNDLVVFNAYDSTALGMAGADFDGDFCFVTKIFVDDFKASDVIIYNDNPGAKGNNVALKYDVFVEQIRKNLVKSRVGLIINANTNVLGLLNDEEALTAYVKFSQYVINTPSWFHEGEKPQTPYNKFRNLRKLANDPVAYAAAVAEARAYFDLLSVILTTMSELEIDSPKSGYKPNFGPEHQIPFVTRWFADIKGKTEKKFDIAEDKDYEDRNGNRVSVRVQRFNHGSNVPLKTGGQRVGIVTDKEVGKKKLRKIDLMYETNDIMSHIHAFVANEIATIEPDYSCCYSLAESYKQSELVDINEYDRIKEEAAALESAYASDIRAIFSSRALSKEEMMGLRKEVIAEYTDKLAALSGDRYSLALAAYCVGEERLMRKGHNNQGINSFVFMCCFDGIHAVAKSISNTDYRVLSINVPPDTARVVVEDGKCRAEGIGQPFLDKVSGIADGLYEVNGTTNGSVKLIVPVMKKANKKAAEGEYNIKVSWKTSEIAEGAKDSRYAVTRMQAEGSVTTIAPTTMNGNLKYVLMVNGEWVGTIFDADKNVSTMSDIAALIGKELKFVCIPVFGKSNTEYYTKKDENGKEFRVYRTANIVTFINTGRDTGYGVMAETAGDNIPGGSFFMDDNNSNWYAADEANYEDMAADMGYTVVLTQEEIDGLEDLSAYDF